MFSCFSYLILAAFEVIGCKIFFETFHGKKEKGNRPGDILWIILLVCSDYLYAVGLSTYFIIKQAAVVLTTAVIMGLYLKISMKKSVVLAALYQALLLAADYIVFAVNSALFSGGNEMEQKYMVKNMLLVAFGKVILFFCVLLVRKQFWKESTGKLADTEWVRFLCFPVFTILTITAMILNFQYVEDQMQANVLFVIALGMLGMNFTVFFLINDIIKREIQLHEKVLLETQVKNQIEMYRSISENYERQKIKSHEFKNHIMCIEALLKQKEYKELEEYVTGISGKIYSERNAINTNHVIVNAILNTKYQEAAEKHIVFVFRVNDLSGIRLCDEDIVIILSNLLNNAIEACEKCEDRKVLKLKFMKEEESVIIAVKNTFHQPVIYENNEIKTTKRSMPEEHGIGIKNIIRTVEKYDGSYTIQEDKEEFYFSILIPL